jgi:hypothetical protein
MKNITTAHVDVAVNTDTEVNVAAVAELGLGYCSICCDDIQFDKGRFVLECGHTYHAKCILMAFQHGNRCPMCRTEVKESEAHRSYMMPSSLRIYSSILHDAADHFIHDLGNITLANVVHRMLLMSSENQDMRSIQRDYIKRLLVQFASMFVRGIAFSIRDGENDVQDPVPIEIVDNANAAVVADADRSIQDREYDAALSNPALDAAVAYQAIVSADLNFDTPDQDNVSSVLLRRSMALAEMGSQRADISLRRARVIALRREQMQETRRILQRAREQAQAEREQAQAEREQAQAEREQAQAEREQAQAVESTENENENMNMVISDSSSQDNDNGDDQNPWGAEF